MFISTEEGEVEVWQVEKGIRKKTFKIKNSGKQKYKSVRDMIISPDESILTCITKTKIIYFCLRELKEIPSQNVNENIENNLNLIKMNQFCKTQKPLNSFDSKDFDFMNLMVDVKNTLFVVNRK